MSDASFWAAANARVTCGEIVALGIQQALDQTPRPGARSRANQLPLTRSARLTHDTSPFGYPSHSFTAQHKQILVKEAWSVV